MNSDKSDNELVEEARNVGGNVQPVVEMMRRLKKATSEQTDAMLKSQDKTNDLTESIRTLTKVLVVLTVIILLLTAVMAWPTVAAWFTTKGTEGKIDMTAQHLNTAGLVIGFFAAVLMAFFPPRVLQYTAQRAPVITWTGGPARKWWGTCQRVLSIAAPIMLAIAFLLQLVALRMP